MVDQEERAKTWRNNAAFLKPNCGFVAVIGDGIIIAVCGMPINLILLEVRCL